MHMPGKIIVPAITGDGARCKAPMSETDAISALKAVREHQHVRETIMKSAKWKKKQEGMKSGLKTPRHRVERPQMTRGWELRAEDDGEDVVETDWVADVDGAGRPAVREVPLVDLLKPGKLRTRDIPGTKYLHF